MIDKIYTYDNKQLAILESNANIKLAKVDAAHKAEIEKFIEMIKAERLRRGTATADERWARAAEMIAGQKSNPGTFRTKVCKTCGNEQPLTPEFYGQPSEGARWQTECRICMARRSKRRREANPEQEREKDAVRRVRNARPVLTPNERAELKERLWNRTNGICLCCAKLILREHMADAEIDHIRPLVEEVNHDETNLAITHPRCNTDKSKNSLEEHWRRQEVRGRDATRITWTLLNDAIAAAGRRSHHG